MSSNEKKIMILCGVGHYFSHFYMLIFPSLALWIHKDFQLSLPLTLNLGFTMYLLFGFMALPMGYLADRWAHRPLLIGMLIGMGLSSLVAGLSPGPGTLTLALASVGVFASIYHPVGIALISKCCRHRGKALGHNGVWGNLGIGLGPLLAGAGATLVGWRTVYILFGLLILILGIAMLGIKLDEKPVEHSDPTASEPKRSNLLSFILILGCMSLLGLCYRGTVVSIPAYFEDRIQALAHLFTIDSNIVASGSNSFGTTVLVSGIYLFGIFGQLTGGRLADKLDLRVAYLLFQSLSLPFMILIGLMSEIPLFVVGMGYLFFSLGMQPIENSLVARLTPNHLRSLAYGLKFILVLGMGAFAVKLVKWAMIQHEPQIVYFIQSGLIATVICLVLLMYGLSRGRQMRNG